MLDALRFIRSATEPYSPKQIKAIVFVVIYVLKVSSRNHDKY